MTMSLPVIVPSTTLTHSLTHSIRRCNVEFGNKRVYKQIWSFDTLTTETNKQDTYVHLDSVYNRLVIWILAAVYTLSQSVLFCENIHSFTRKTRTIYQRFNTEIK